MLVVDRHGEAERAALLAERPSKSPRQPCTPCTKTPTSIVMPASAEPTRSMIHNGHTSAQKCGDPARSGQRRRAGSAEVEVCYWPTSATAASAPR